MTTTNDTSAFDIFTEKYRARHKKEGWTFQGLRGIEMEFFIRDKHTKLLVPKIRELLDQIKELAPDLFKEGLFQKELSLWQVEVISRPFKTWMECIFNHTHLMSIAQQAADDLGLYLDDTACVSFDLVKQSLEAILEEKITATDLDDLTVDQVAHVIYPDEDGRYHGFLRERPAAVKRMICVAGTHLHRECETYEHTLYVVSRWNQHARGAKSRGFYGEGRFEAFIEHITPGGGFIPAPYLTPEAHYKEAQRAGYDTEISTDFATARVHHTNPTAEDRKFKPTHNPGELRGWCVWVDGHYDAATRDYHASIQRPPGAPPSRPRRPAFPA